MTEIIKTEENSVSPIQRTDNEILLEVEKILKDMQEKTLEQNLKTDVYFSKVNDYIDFQMLPKEVQTVQNSDVEMLETLQVLVENTSPTPEDNQVQTALYYGNLSLILVVMGVLPAYIAYRLIKTVISLTSHIL